MRPKLLSRRNLLGGLALAAGWSQSGPASAQQSLLEQLRQGGLLLFMRHANAPGIGDPQNFRIADCTTQRNLSDRGRAQAVAVGARLRSEGISWASAQSSRWCRCLDTARLAFGMVEPFDLLNSSFAGRPDATPDLRRHLLALPRDGANRVYVTHMVNIVALLNFNTADAEIVVARRNGDAIQPVANLRPPA